jgi:hypothetical protein
MSFNSPSVRKAYSEGNRQCPNCRRLRCLTPVATSFMGAQKPDDVLVCMSCGSEFTRRQLDDLTYGTNKAIAKVSKLRRKEGVRRKLLDDVPKAKTGPKRKDGSDD